MIDDFRHASRNETELELRMVHDEALEIARAISELVRQSLVKVPRVLCVQIAIHIDGSIAISELSEDEHGTDLAAPFYRLRTVAHRAWLFNNLAQHIIESHDNGVSVFHPSGRFARLVVVWPNIRGTVAPIECSPVRLPQGRASTMSIVAPQMTEA